MRRGVMLAGLALALLLAALWLGGGFTALRLWAEEATRAVQRDMAGAVRAIAQGALFNCERVKAIDGERP